MPNTTMPTTEISPVQAAQATTESKSTSSNSSSHINKITYLQRKTTEQGEVIEQKVAAEVTDEQLAIINRDTELVIQGVKAANQERLFSDGQGRMPKNKIGQIWNAVTRHLPGVFGRIGKDFTGHERAIIQGKIVEQVLARGESVSTQQITTGLADVAASVLRAKGIGGKDLFNKKQVDAASDRLKKSAQSEYANRQRAEQNVSAIVYGKIRKAAESNLKLADIKSKSPEEQLNWLKENVLRGVPDQIIDAVNPSAIIDEIAREKLQMYAQQEASSLQIDAINSRIKKVLDMAKATGLLNKDTEKWILENGVAKKFDWVVQKGGKALIGLGFATAGIVLTLSGLSPVAALAAAIYHTALPILTSAWLARKGFDIHYQKARAGREADRAMLAGAAVTPADKKGLGVRLLGMMGTSGYEAQSQEFLARRAGRGSYQSADILIKGGERTNIDGKKEKANSIQDLKDQLGTAVETNSNVEKALKDLADRASEIQELLFAGRLQLSDGQTAADILKQLGDIDIFVKFNAGSSFSAYRNMVSNHATEVASNISSFKKAEKNDVRKAMIGGMTKQVVLTTAVYPLVGGVLGSLGTHAVMDLAGHGVSGFSHFNVDAQESLLTGAKAFDTSNPLFALNDLITGKGIAEDFLGNIGISQSVINAEQLQNAVSDILNGKTNANPELVFTLQHLSPSDQENFIASYQALGGYLQTGRIDLDGLNLGQKEWIAAQANDLLSQPGSLPSGTSTHLEALIHELGKVNPTKESNQLVAARMAFVTGANYDKVLTEINSQKVRAGEAATGTAVLNHAVDTQNGSEIPYTPGKPDASVNLENNAQPVDLPKNFNDWNTANSANGTYPNGYFTITKVDGLHAEIDFVDPSGHHIQVATDIHWDSQDHSKIDFLNSINGGGASASSGDVLGNYDHNLDGFYGSNHVTSNFADMIASEKDYTVMYNSLNLNEVVVINPTDNVYDFLNHPSNYDSIFSAIKNSANPGDYFLIQHNGSYYWGVLSRDGNLHLISANQIHSFSDLQNTQIGDSNISQGSFNELTKAGELAGGAGKNIEGNTVVSRSSFDLTNESIFTAASNPGGVNLTPSSLAEGIGAGLVGMLPVNAGAEFIRQRTSSRPNSNGRPNVINRTARVVRNTGIPGLANIARFGPFNAWARNNAVGKNRYDKIQGAERLRDLSSTELTALAAGLGAGALTNPKFNLFNPSSYRPIDRQRLALSSWLAENKNLSAELIGIGVNRARQRGRRVTVEDMQVPLAIAAMDHTELFPNAAGTGKIKGIDNKTGFFETNPNLLSDIGLTSGSGYPKNTGYHPNARRLAELMADPTNLAARGRNLGDLSADVTAALQGANNYAEVLSAFDGLIPPRDGVEMIQRVYNGPHNATNTIVTTVIPELLGSGVTPDTATFNDLVDYLTTAPAGTAPTITRADLMKNLRTAGAVGLLYTKITTETKLLDILDSNFPPGDRAEFVVSQIPDLNDPTTHPTTGDVINTLSSKLQSMLGLAYGINGKELAEALKYGYDLANDGRVTPLDVNNITEVSDGVAQITRDYLVRSGAHASSLPELPAHITALASQEAISAWFVQDAVAATGNKGEILHAALEANFFVRTLVPPPNFNEAAKAVVAARIAATTPDAAGATLMTPDEFNAGLRARINELETATPPATPVLALDDVKDLVAAVYTELNTNGVHLAENLDVVLAIAGKDLTQTLTTGHPRPALIDSLYELVNLAVPLSELNAAIERQGLAIGDREIVAKSVVEYGNYLNGLGAGLNPQELMERAYAFAGLNSGMTSADKLVIVKAAYDAHPAPKPTKDEIKAALTVNGVVDVRSQASIIAGLMTSYEAATAFITAPATIDQLTPIAQGLIDAGKPLSEIITEMRAQRGVLLIPDLARESYDLAVKSVASGGLGLNEADAAKLAALVAAPKKGGAGDEGEEFKAFYDEMTIKGRTPDEIKTAVAQIKDNMSVGDHEAVGKDVIVKLIDLLVPTGDYDSLSDSDIKDQIDIMLVIIGGSKNAHLKSVIGPALRALGSGTAHPIKTKQVNKALAGVTW